MKLKITRLSTWLGAISILASMASMSQGCTITNDGGLTGGNFYGNDGGGILPQDSGNTNQCDTCMSQQCNGQWAVCQSSKECLTIYACAIACTSGDDACVTQCYQAHPLGQSAYYALAACDYYGFCGTCKASCQVPTNYCTPSTTTQDAGQDAEQDAAQVTPDASNPYPDAAVEDCISCKASKCSAEQSACAMGTKCDQYTICLGGCEDLTCFDQCASTNSEGKDASTKLNDCILANCKMTCGL